MPYKDDSSNEPPSDNTSSDEAPSNDLPSALAKRALPDINLVISLLKQHGFVPTASHKMMAMARDLLEARQDPGDVNTVINQLVAAGYNPADFGPQASHFAKSFFTANLPTETTALCPQDNNTLYNSGRVTYIINCQWDYPGSDLTFTKTNNMADCLKACSAYKGQ